jgi:hypothetical protein
MPIFFTGRLCLRRDSLRMQGRAADDVSLSLSRLPARDGRSVFFCHRNAGNGLQATARDAALVFHDVEVVPSVSHLLVAAVV